MNRFEYCGRLVAKTFSTISRLRSKVGLYCGEVVEINAELPKKPEIVNAEPYGKGWMIVIKLADIKEWDGLISAADYEKLVAAAGH